MMFVTPLYAQDTSMVLVPKSTLTNEQIVSLKAESYGKWVGIGSEIGKAVNSSLEALSENTAKFSKTGVGRVAIWLVVWKVVGSDILGILFALMILLVGVPITIWSYKKHLSQTVLDSSVTDESGKVHNTYRPLEYSERSDREVVLSVHAIIMLVLFVSSAIAIFG